jgi:cell division septum initiation protein DivIVA
MTRYWLAVLMLLPCLVLAQEKKQAERPRPENMVTRMIHLEHANPQQVRNLLVNTGTRAQWDDVLRVVVFSGSPSEVASVEQTIKQLDAEMAKATVSNAELTVYVLGASQEGGQNQVPAALQNSADQIKAACPYQSFRLLETAIARCRVGEGTRVSGSLQPFQDNQPSGMGAPSYQIRFNLSGADNVGTREVFRIQDFSFYAGFPYVVKAPNTTQYQKSEVSIGTNFDISSNQQVVIGKAGVAGNSAVFLIVEAKAVK